MVAFITVDKDLAYLVAGKAAGRTGANYTEAWRTAEWKGRKAQLVVLADGETAAVRWLGRAVQGRHVSTRDRLVKVTEVHEIQPIPAATIRKYWSDPKSRLGGHNDGLLDDEETDSLVIAILNVDRSLANLLASLDRPDTPLLGSGLRGELFNQERDALGLILNLSGIERNELSRWSPPVGDVPFLAGMPSYLEREDVLVDHDLHRFGDWLGQANARVGWRTFTNGERRVFVMNANRSPVEHTLGVDMVYFNENRNSFVLVQYKKMRPETGRNGRRSLYYRPDDQLWIELARMQQVNEQCIRADGEFRLHWGASWLKLCDPDPTIEDPTALIKGMYFALDHFAELLRTRHGPKGGIRIGYENVDRHLSNTMFLDLVRDGWIGSRGPASETIKTILHDSLASGRAVVLGVEPRPPKPE